MERQKPLSWAFSFIHKIQTLVRNEEIGWRKIFSDVGLLSTDLDEINLYRVRDIAFAQSLFDKIFVCMI